MCLIYSILPDSLTSPAIMIDSPLKSYRSAHISSKSGNSSPMSNAQKEEELITYLNTPSTTPKRNGIEITPIPPTTPSSQLMETSLKNMDTDSILHSGRTTPDSLQIVLDLSDNEEDTIPDLNKENLILRNEVERLRNELLVTTHVERSIENVDSDNKKKIESLRREYEYRLNQQRLEMEHLTKRSRNGEARKDLKKAQKSLDEKTEMLTKQRNEYQKEINVLRETLRAREIESSENMMKLGELQSALERSRSDLNSTRQELEQHRARALKTLQEKEKLIADLRNNSTAGSDNATMMVEFNQLR